MRSMFCCLRLPISSTQAAWRLICPGFSAALNAANTDLMSPTTGAAIARLLSISVGEMSTWTNSRVLGPQRRPAVRQQPVEPRPGQHHDIGVADRIGAGGGGRLRMVVGQEALGHRHRQERDARRLDKRADLLVRPRIGRALAEDHQRALGIRQQFDGARDRLRRRRLRRRRVDDLDQRLLRRSPRRAPSRAPRPSGRDRRRPGAPTTAARIARAMPMPMSCGRLTR